MKTGFGNFFILHGQGAPNHQQVFNQAADYFNEWYYGEMINLLGLNPIVMGWFKGLKTLKQQKEDCFTLHAGMAEACSMILL